MSPIGHANGIVYKRDMGDNKKRTGLWKSYAYENGFIHPKGITVSKLY
jgi:hypothetical protein